MLAQLKVKNYAIIDEIAVTLAPGFNALTGETGAGKSIIVGALSFALGEKVSDEVVRKGQETCRVEAVFKLGAPMLAKVQDLVSELEAPDGIVRLEREISRGGRSRPLLNGCRVRLARMRQLGNLLVDFHGQHEHQLLLDPGTHIDFLDSFADVMPLRERYSARRHDLMDIKRRIRELEQEIEHMNEREDLIRYEIREIEELDLKNGEDEAIAAEVGLLENAEKILEAGNEAMDVLYEGDETAIRSISQAAALLERLGEYSDELATLGRNLEEAEVIVKEAAESLRDYLAGIDLDPSHLEGLRERQVIVERIKRKYGKSVADVLTHLRRLRQGLDNKEDLDVELAGLKSEMVGVADEVAGLARDLSAARKAAAGGFEKAVESELGTLGMDGGGFKVVFEDLDEGEEVESRDGKKSTLGEKGFDTVEFFVRTNKGENMLPLRRIASGGEISRVMLGLKRILAEADQVDVMVFDEIDAGIGGGMADVVGAKLREVSGSRQVVCITHLPQIAAPADLHLAVGKSSTGGRTVTEVTRVEGRSRVEELARMIGGKTAPLSARLHAEEILKRAVAK